MRFFINFILAASARTYGSIRREIARITDPYFWINMLRIEFYYLVIYRHTADLNYSQPWCISLLVSYEEAEDETRWDHDPGIQEACDTSMMYASWSPGSDRSVSHIYCFMIEVSCLVIYCCITHYSQRWYISITASYTEAIMPSIRYITQRILWVVYRNWRS